MPVRAVQGSRWPPQPLVWEVGGIQAELGVSVAEIVGRHAEVGSD